MKSTSKTILILLLILAIGIMGCGASKTVKGGAIGAGAGAIIGGIIGKQAGNTALGAIIGATVGGTAGALIGNYMDRQAEEIKQDLKNAKVERVGEGIKITFDSGILFDVNKSDLRTEARTNVGKLAEILNKYDDTDILIEGHTDSTGSDEHNQKLSEQRSAAVSNYAKGLGVKGSRFTSVGYGESQPIAANSTSEGRQSNRRVEIAIFANEKLIEAAQNNQIE